MDSNRCFVESRLVEAKIAAMKAPHSPSFYVSGDLGHSNVSLPSSQLQETCTSCSKCELMKAGLFANIIQI